MSRKGLYLAVGFVWGVVISAGVALAVSAIAAGVAWIYLFGDETWPGWANWAILGAGAVAGLLSLSICMLVARIVANRYDEPANEHHTEHGGAGLAWLLLLTGFLAAGGFVWWEFGRQAEILTASEQADQADKYFPTLVSDTHRISGIDVDWPGGGADGKAMVVLEGLREGEYRFSWLIRDSLYDEPLLDGMQILQLTSGARRIDIPMPAERIVDGYRRLLNRQDGNLLVDEPFLFEARLAPVPNINEIQQMPAHEVQNLNNGQSSLIDRSSAKFAVRFFLYGETLSWE